MIASRTSLRGGTTKQSHEKKREQQTDCFVLRPRNDGKRHNGVKSRINN